MAGFTRSIDSGSHGSFPSGCEAASRGNAEELWGSWQVASLGKLYEKMVKQGRLGGDLLASTARVAACAERDNPTAVLLFGELTKALPELRCVIHNDACHLLRLAAHSALAAVFIKDRCPLHTGHRDPCCSASCVLDKPVEILQQLLTSRLEAMSSRDFAVTVLLTV